jgi:ABC-type transport system involved in multi-copper enzyme maturation permease subunit
LWLLGHPPGVPRAREVGVQPWTKAGLIVKQNTEAGSAYAAVLLTGGHGVRMQYNFTGDVAGRGGTASTADPRWLRLVRTGSTLTGYESTDGTTWTKVGATRLAGLSSTVQAGMFVASPARETYEQHVGDIVGTSSPTMATAVFDNVGLQGSWPAGTWTHDAVGEGRGDLEQAGDTFTVQGSGDIAPVVDNTGGALERTLVGAFAGLTVLIVLGVLFVTTEYRRGMIRTTFAASPRRGRVLAAKAVVIGAVSFVTGLISGAIARPLCAYLLRRNGNILLPVNRLTELRLVVGTAALLAVAAVFALAVGMLLRRSAAAVAVVVVLILMPYILSSVAVLPVGPARWLLYLFSILAGVISNPHWHRHVQQIGPSSAGLAIQATVGLHGLPIGPWAGLGVLGLWASGALLVGGLLLQIRDA